MSNSQVKRDSSHRRVVPVSGCMVLSGWIADALLFWLRRFLLLLLLLLLLLWLAARSNSICSRVIAPITYNVYCFYVVDSRAFCAHATLPY